MSKIVRVLKANTYPNSIGVQYLIFDTETREVREVGDVIRDKSDPLTYGQTNADKLFNDGQIVTDGLQKLQALDNKANESVYESALYEGIQALRDGGGLSDMNTAMEAIYTNADLNTQLLTDFFLAYRDATDNQRYRFDVLMYITLNGLMRQSEQ